MFQKHILKKEDFGIVICFEWRIKSNVSNRKSNILVHEKKEKKRKKYIFPSFFIE
jgi:hypothetical protein